MHAVSLSNNRDRKHVKLYWCMSCSCKLDLSRIYIYIYICIRSLTSCLVEHSLGVVPSLFALCIAHWFTSLSTLARYDEPGLNLALRIFYSSLLSSSASFLCAALMSPQRTKQYCPQIEYIYVYKLNTYTLQCMTTPQKN